MSARAPRRTFATPLVITLAAACSGPVYTNPPPQQMSHNPPAQDPPPPVPVHPENPPPPQEPPPTNPPPPTTGPVVQTSTADRSWTVYKADGACHAYHDISCNPQATCNPPPPVDYACPAGFTDTSRVKIVQPANAAECYIIGEPVKCPPNARCKQADHTPTPCPTR